MFVCNDLPRLDTHLRRPEAKCKKFVVGEGNNEVFNSVSFNEDNSEITLVKGDNIYLYCSEVCVSDLVKLEVIFITEDTMLVSLIDGGVYVKATGGALIYCQDNGEYHQVSPDAKEMQHATWVNTESIKRFARCTLGMSSYNVGYTATEKAANLYLYNLCFAINLSYEMIKSPRQQGAWTLKYSCDGTEILCDEDLPLYESAAAKTERKRNEDAETAFYEEYMEEEDDIEYDSEDEDEDVEDCF